MLSFDLNIINKIMATDVKGLHDLVREGKIDGYEVLDAVTEWISQLQEKGTKLQTYRNILQAHYFNVLRRRKIVNITYVTTALSIIQLYQLDEKYLAGLLRGSKYYIVKKFGHVGGTVFYVPSPKEIIKELKDSRSNDVLMNFMISNSCFSYRKQMSLMVNRLRITQ